MNSFLKSISFSILLVSSIVFCNQLNAQNWDINLLKQINPSNPNSSTWKNISSTSEPICVAAPIGMFAVSLINHDQNLKKNAIKLAESVVISAAITEVMKVAINRNRPFVKYPLDVFPNQIDELGKSMPSAHTALAFTTATSVYLAYPKWYVYVPALAWASAVGYSRMDLGVHYPSDVLMGAVTGAGSAYLCYKGQQWLHKRKKKVIE